MSDPELGADVLVPALWALIVALLVCRGSIKIEYTLARHGAERLWKLLKTEPFVNSLGALTGKPCSCCCLAAVLTAPAAQPEHWLPVPALLCCDMSTSLPWTPAFPVVQVGRLCRWSRAG